MQIPVVTIDGLTGTGKSTVRCGVAEELGWHEHDSGALFRATGLLAHERGVSSEKGCAEIASQLRIYVHGEKVFIGEVNRTKEIRSTQCGVWASEVAKFASVHESLREYQLSLRRNPGLVADGRDMAFIFDPAFRFVLTTQIRVRAAWRVAQLEKLGQPADFDSVLQNIEARDQSDLTRDTNPYRVHPKAIPIDNSNLTVQETVAPIVQKVREMIGQQQLVR